MNNKLKSHNDVLEAIATAIDIPDYMNERACARYQSIGKWLDREESSIAHLAPSISPQGSFLLGTVIRPLGDTDAYDIDLVCKLDQTKTDTTMKKLKEAVGHEVKSYAATNNMQKEPEEARRCWALEYADEAQFHMDILPAIPDIENYRKKLVEASANDLLINTKIVENAIAITDKMLPQYSNITTDWPISNPKGYAAWFASKQIDTFKARKGLLVEQGSYASVDDVPDYKVKTPLQRSIQLLKRHRDSMFEGDENKPISIVITTLAAHAYQGEESLSQALRSILRDMQKFIHNKGGVVWIPNPVNPQENFADKWAEIPEKQQNFFLWLEKAQNHFGSYLANSYENIPLSLQESMSETTIKKIEPLISSSNTKSVSDILLSEVEHVKTSGPITKPWYG